MPTGLAAPRAGPQQQDPRARATPVVLRASDAQPTRREASHGAATPRAQTRLATSADELGAGPQTAGTRGHAPPSAQMPQLHALWDLPVVPRCDANSTKPMPMRIGACYLAGGRRSWRSLAVVDPSLDLCQSQTYNHASFLQPHK
jgi:hypothetical protein